MDGFRPGHVDGLRPYMFNKGPPGALMAKHRIYTTSFASVYPLYIAKAEKKGRKKQRSIRSSLG